MDFDPQKNYYEILGVSEDASQDEIKKAFRMAAIKHHPDKGGDKAKFQAVNEAHGILSDEKIRQQYDAYRKGGFGGVGGDFGGFGGGFGGFDVDLGDLVGDFFGGGSKRKSSRGEDIQISLNLEFDEAYLGVNKKMRYTRRILASDVDRITCDHCDGRGVTTQQARTPFGVMQVQNTCQICGGLGSLFEKNGKRIPGGLEETKEIIEVGVPAGIKEGVYLKYGGKGHMGPGGQTGDLYIKLYIKHSDIYTREEDDMYISRSLSVFDVVLGASISIDHPEGSLTVKIPKGTQTNDLIKVSNKGFGKKGILGSRGNLYIKPKIIIPKKLSKEEEELWKQLQKKAK